MRLIVALTVIGLSAGGLGAQTRPSADCSRFRTAIDESEKAISATQAEGLADNSAPRATLREQRITNELQSIRLNLDLMIQHRCPLPTEPISQHTYLRNALTCETDRLRGSTTPESCDRKTWTRAQADSTATP